MASNISTQSATILSDVNLHAQAETEMDVDMSSSPTTPNFSTLPSEILQRILHFSTTPTFLQLILVNRQLFDVAAESREVLLHHLQNLPGLKLGLRDHCVTTADLFLILRQRAANNLYGTNFTADCSSFAFSNNISPISQVSSLAVGTDGCPELSMVVNHDASIRLYTHHGSYRDTIESPYADGKASIIQVVQHYSTLSVLYAWTPPEEDLATKVEDHEATIKGSSRHALTTIEEPIFNSPNGLFRANQNLLPKAVRSIRYHMLHYNMFTKERPIFFHIPTHQSLRHTILAPVHLAVHSRVLCAIVWDEPGTLRPTSRVSVVLYNAERLPRKDEGIYSAFVVYPFDHIAPIHSSGTRSTLSNDQFLSIDDHDGSSGKQLWTRTNLKEAEYDRDLRLTDIHFKPRATAFFKDGRRLALYAPGSSVPYMTLLSNRILRQQMVPTNSDMRPMRPHTTLSLDMRHHRLCRGVSSTNATTVHGMRFQLSMPFFSKHESVFMRNGDDYCVTHDLCIGSAKIPDTMVFSRGQLSLDTPGPPVLTIVQIRRRKPFDACMHVETKDDLPPLPPPPRSRPRRIDPAVDVEAPNTNAHTTLNDEDDIDHLASAPTYTQDLEQNFEIHEETEFFERSLVTAELRVVARLWGWAPQSTTLTGLNTVSDSPNGQRIAISQWDRVLIYALDPVALCERPFDFDLDAADSNDGSSSAAATDWGTTSDSGSESGDDVDANSNQGLGVQAGPPPAATSTDSDGPPLLTNHSAIDNALSNNNNVSDDDADDNENNSQSEQPALSTEDAASPPTPAQAPPLPEPISPAVPEPPSTAFPHPAPPTSPKSTASTSRASSQSTTASARLLKFYPHTHDGLLGRRVVELRPIVLKMEHGAVVKKMIWSENSSSSDGDGDGEGVEEDETEKETDVEGDFVEAGKNDTSNNDPPPLPSSNDSAESLGSDTNSTSVRNTSQQSSASPSTATNARATTRKSMPATSSTTNTSTIPETGSSSGLTPESRLQISDSELKHQIRFVKRPPEYTMVLNSEVIDLDIKFRRKTDGGGRDDGDDHAVSVADDDTQNDEDGDDKQKGAERDNDTAHDEAMSNPDLDSKKKHDDDDTNDEAESTNRPASPLHATAAAAAAASPSPTQYPASVASSATERLRPRAKRRRRKKAMENELVVLTDRDVQVWDLGVWGTGKRVESELKFQRVESW